MVQSSNIGRCIALYAIATGGALLALSPLNAADDTQGRYTMTPADGGGFVRLDRQTGAMSICTGKEGEWACKPMPETDADTKRKLEELESENRALRAQQAMREKPQAAVPGDTVPPDAPPTGDTVPPVPPGNLPIPNEKDVDKLFDYVEGMVKKFKERIERLEKEASKDPETAL